MHSVQSSELDGCYAGACLCLTAFAPIPCIREEGNFHAWTSLCECISVCVYVYVHIYVGLLPEGISLSGRFSLRICSVRTKRGRLYASRVDSRFLRFDEPNVGNFILALILTLLYGHRESLRLMKGVPRRFPTCVRTH